MTRRTPLLFVLLGAAVSSAACGEGESESTSEEGASTDVSMDGGRARDRGSKGSGADASLDHAVADVDAIPDAAHADDANVDVDASVASDANVDSDAEGPVLAALGQPCLLDNDCAAGATCVAQRCAYAYLEDTDTTPALPAPSGALPNIVAIDSLPFPRVALSENPQLKGPAAVFGKYHSLSSRAHSYATISAIRQQFPDVMFIRYFSPRAYQGAGELYGKQAAGMPYWSTGLASEASPAANYSMFAGHWLYKTGTRTTAPIGATDDAVTVTVDNPNAVTVGEFVVVYDDEPLPAHLFQNAEHLRVSAIDGDRLTLDRTGLRFDGRNKSEAKAHASNSILAMHQSGQAPGPWTWAYNMGTSCPRDANGKTAGEALASWLVDNYDRDASGTPTTFQVEGIMFDADLFFDYHPVDINNDLVTDQGIDLATGENLHGHGLQYFYSLLRSSPKLASRLIVGGGQNSRTSVALNGTQEESIPADRPLDPIPTYNRFDSALSRFTRRVHHSGVGPLYSEVFIRLPTKSYPNQANVTGPSDAPFRFALGVALLEGAFFCVENSQYALDPWFDEYAVDVEPGSAHYGQAIHRSEGTATLRRHRGWMGMPMGFRLRRYDDSFAPTTSLLAMNHKNGSFDEGLADWTASNVTLSHDITTRMDGAASLQASRPLVYSPTFPGASVIGPTFSLVENQEYTVAFSAKADAEREFRVFLGSGTGHLLMIGTEWARHVITFQPPTTGDAELRFEVGRESTTFWLDSVYVFQGNPDVFVREFDKGVVLVNATRTQQTIHFDRTLQRILGTQNPDVNNGLLLTSVEVPAYDAAILVKP